DPVARGARERIPVCRRPTEARPPASPGRIRDTPGRQRRHRERAGLARRPRSRLPGRCFRGSAPPAAGEHPKGSVGALLETSHGGAGQAFFHTKSLKMRAIVAEESVARSHPEKPGAVLQQAGDRRIEPVVGTELAEPVPGGGGIGRYQQHSEQQSWSAKLHLRELSARTEENFERASGRQNAYPYSEAKAMTATAPSRSRL